MKTSSIRACGILVAVAAIVGSCGGGSLTLSEYAERAEDLVSEVRERIDTLDADWESQVPTLEGAQTYWDLRLAARVAFLDGLTELDPPDEAEQLHGTVLDLMDRFIEAEESLAARVAMFDTVTDHWQWWDTPEGEAARALDEEVTAICRVAQVRFDATEDREVLAEADWIPTEMKEVVRVAFGCAE